MAKHLIYYFSGTGNSLWTALSIQKALGSCDVIFMGNAPDPPSAAESIGFVFPCYGGGLPAQVERFIAGVDFSKQADTYYYAVVTHGGVPYKSALGMTQALLQQRNIELDFAAGLKSFDNYVIGYELSNKVAEKTAASKTALQEIIPRIVQRESTPLKRPSVFIGRFNRAFSKDFSTRDANFNTDASCNGCMVCERVCPARNIQMQDGRPSWQHHCEQCLACLHWCPERAINYAEKTRARRRYTHPEITARMFIDHLDSANNGH